VPLDGKKYWLFSKDAVSKSLLSASAVVTELKKNPKLFSEKCLCTEPDKIWKFPVSFGFSQINEVEMEREYQRQLDLLKVGDCDDVLWTMFCRGAKWSETHRISKNT
jgi:hypothetical protein